MIPDNPTKNGLPPVTASVTLPDDFTLSTLLALIRDIASERYDVADAIKLYKLTAEQYTALSSQPYFQETLKRFIEDWHRPSSTEDRVRVQSAWSVEMLLPAMTARAMNPHESLQSINETVKVLADLARLGGKNTAPPAASEKFVINIDLGGDVHRIETSRPVIEAQVEPAPVRTDSEGQTLPPALPSQPQGLGDGTSIFDVPQRPAPVRPV